jgi:hypothetical protein
MVALDPQGIPLGGLVDSASPAEVTPAEAALKQIRVPGKGGLPKLGQNGSLQTRHITGCTQGKAEKTWNLSFAPIPGETVSITEFKTAKSELTDARGGSSGEPSDGSADSNASWCDTRTI